MMQPNRDSVDRQPGREEPAQGEERLPAEFFENASIGIHLVGPDGTILRANQTELDRLGFRREEYVGRHIAEFHVDRAVIDDILARLNCGETLHRHPARLRAKDGSIRDVIISTSALFENGKFIHSRCFTLDVTDQRRAERALQESESRFRTLADAAPVLIWMWGPNKEGVYFNQPWIDFTGKPIEKQLGEGWLELVHPDDRGPLYEICNEGFRKRQPFTAEFRLRRADGQYRWLLDSGTPWFDPCGAFQGFIGSCVDITERKEAEEARAFLAAIVESTDDAVVSKSLDGRITSWNAGAERLLGYAADEAVGRQINLIIPPELQDEERIILQRLRQGHRIEHFETVRVRKDGRRIDISLTISPIRGGDGQVIGASKVARDITERKLADEVRRDGEQRLRLALEAGQMGTWEWKIDTNEVIWSPGLEIIHGLEPGSFRGTFADFQNDIHPQDRERVIHSIFRTLDEGDDHHIEYRLIRPDGSLRWVEGRGKLFRNDAGAPVRMIGVCIDITDRKHAELAHSESEERFARFMQNLPGLAWIKDDEGRYVYVNDAAEKVFQTPRERLYGRTDEEIFPTETAALFKENDRRALVSETGVQEEKTLLHEDGLLHHSIVSKFPIPGRNGQPTLVGGMAIDITDRKHAEEALKRSEERYRAIVEGQTEMVCRFRTDGTILFVNGAYARARGTMPQALLGANFWDFIAPEDQPDVRATLDRMHPDSPEVRIENRFETAEGARWTLWTNRGLHFDASGRATEVQSAGIDITDRIQLEQSLKFLAEASRSLSSLVDYKSTLQQVAQLAVPGFADWCSVDMLDAHGVLQRLAVAHVDPGKVRLAEEYYRRYPPDPGAPHGAQHVVRTGQPELVTTVTESMLIAAARDEEQLRILRELDPKSYMCVPLAAKGKTFGAINFVSAESGRRYGADDLVMAQDLAHRAAIAIENARLYQSLQLELAVRRKAEERLVLARLAAEVANRSKSEFLANMSHEIRTPMTAILGYTDVLRLHLQNSDDIYCVDTIRRNGEYLLEIIGDILDLSRIEAGKLEIEKQRFAPDELLFDIRSLMEVRAAEKGVPLHVEYDGLLPATIESDPTRLRQILVNLIGNAIKFTDVGSVRLVVRFVPGAEVGVETAEVRGQGSGVRGQRSEDEVQGSDLRSGPLDDGSRPAKAGSGARLEFSVIDTGIGIEPQQQRRLFEPFTQADSSVTRRFGGSGLGLSISHRLAQMLGGEIAVQSEPGKGSTFTLTIAPGVPADVPLVEPRQEITSTASQVALPRRLACRVLVVDDRSDVRHLAQHFLEEAGAEVLAAANGREALTKVSQAEERGLPVHLVLLDMQMPVMDGYEAATRLRQNGYEGPVVALTAHAMKGDYQRCLEAGCDAYVTKPIDRQKMVEVVARYTQDVSIEQLRAQRLSLLPTRRPRSAASIESAPARQPRETPGPRRVLIVDDSPDACRALQLLLQAKGHHIAVAKNGAEAFHAATEHRPEIVLLDLSLPDMSGHDVARRLRSTAQTKDALLIAVSGHDSPEDIRLSREAGCDHHLVKPASIAKLEQLFTRVGRRG